MTTKITKLLATVLIFLCSYTAESKNDPKTKYAENSPTIADQNKIETIWGSLNCHRVGRYLFVSYQKSSNICMVINRDIKTDAGKINMVKIFPDNGPSKAYRYVKSYPYLHWNLNGSVQAYTCFVLPTQQ